MNNELICPPRPYYVSNDGTDDSGVSGDIDNPFQNLKLHNFKNYKSRYNISQNRFLYI